MAVHEVSGVRHFVGGDGDTKPTTGVPPGSTFTESDGDVAKRYIFDGTAWVLEVVTTDSVPS